MTRTPLLVIESAGPDATERTGRYRPPESGVLGIKAAECSAMLCRRLTGGGVGSIGRRRLRVSGGTGSLALRLVQPTCDPLNDPAARSAFRAVWSVRPKVG